MKLDELKMVKQFKWMLEKEQKVVFYKWLRNALPQHSVKGMPSLNDKPNDRDDSRAIVPAGKVGSSCSRSSGSAQPPEKKTRINGRQGHTNNSGVTKEELMNSLFPRRKNGKVR